MKNFTFSTDVQGFDYALANNDRFDTHDEALQAAIDFYNAYTGEVANPWTIEHGCPRMMFVWDIVEETAKKEGAVSTDKATPGTWTRTAVRYNSEKQVWYSHIDSDTGPRIARVSSSVSEDECEANATLIANAKVNAELVTELTEALKVAERVIRSQNALYVHEYRTIRQALEKAKEAQR